MQPELTRPIRERSAPLFRSSVENIANCLGLEQMFARRTALASGSGTWLPALEVVRRAQMMSRQIARRKCLVLELMFTCNKVRQPVVSVLVMLEGSSSIFEGEMRGRHANQGSESELVGSRVSGAYDPAQGGLFPMNVAVTYLTLSERLAACPAPITSANRDLSFRTTRSKTKQPEFLRIKHRVKNLCATSWG
jgi:hypothetical protein